MLALALGAFFVPVGLLITIPATQPIATALGFLTATLLSLQNAYAADFVSYADGSFAALSGVAAATVVTALIRSVGAEWSARRLLRAVWRDLARIPGRQAPHERNALTAVLVDRLGLLVPRLAAVGAGNDLAAVDTLTDLRIGLNMMGLQRDCETMAPAVQAAVDAVLRATGRHFARQTAAGRTRRPEPALLAAIDRAMNIVVATPGERARDMLLQLVGICRGLFLEAPPYHPPQDHAPPTQAVA